MKKFHVAAALAGAVFFVFCPSVTADETGWFMPRGRDRFVGEGLILAKGAWPDVPYVSTPCEVVNEMIRLADVRADDVVYDLGCGDGRLVIEAARRAGCRGVGIDIDPARIKESRAGARLAGLEDRARFVQQDFFQSDIRDATVMLIYLFPDINIRLRSKFLGEMKPGSRLVSHAFDMGDWKPDGVSNVLAQRVYRWVIPANVTGTWKATIPGKRQVAFDLEIDQRYQQIRGTLRQGDVSAELVDAKLAGDRVAFAVEQVVGGIRTRREFTGVVNGDAIAGTVVAKGRSKAQTAKWRALRDPSTRRPVETGYQKSALPRYWEKGSG